jgi:hypothetical protein
MTDTAFLYRALRPEEINRGVLFPKACGPFLADPMLPQVLPFTLGKRGEHAVRAHQREGRYPTSGVSTTPHLKRAEHYAQHHRTIARISVARLAEFQVRTFCVADYVDESLICAPEDHEVILVRPGVESLPAEIIDEIFDMSSGHLPSQWS